MSGKASDRPYGHRAVPDATGRYCAECLNKIKHVQPVWRDDPGWRHESERDMRAQRRHE